MENKNILYVLNSVKNLIEFLYTQETNKYFIEVKWYENNTRILIKEQFSENNILDIKLAGTINLYYFIESNLLKMAIDNIDAFGYLTTRYINGAREIQSEHLRTKNIEIDLPIYSHLGLMAAEKNNEIMLNKLNANNQKQKIIIK